MQYKIVEFIFVMSKWVILNCSNQMFLHSTWFDRSNLTNCRCPFRVHKDVPHFPCGGCTIVSPCRDSQSLTYYPRQCCMRVMATWFKPNTSHISSLEAEQADFLIILSSDVVRMWHWQRYDPPWLSTSWLVKRGRGWEGEAAGGKELG